MGLGCVGGHSEIQWLYVLRCDLERENPSQAAFKDTGVLTASYLRSDPTLKVLDAEELLKWPPKYIADRLIGTFFRRFHPCFPIIAKTTFVAQYRLFYSSKNARPKKQWLALLNIVFALAERHLSLVEEQHDCLPFFSRSWRLCMDQMSLREHPNLQQVQIEALTAFYLLSSGEINRLVPPPSVYPSSLFEALHMMFPSRSWKVCGLAMRSAQTLGLHLRNDCRRVSPFSKEIRYRMWWSIYQLDTLLSTMTGRPLCPDERFSVTPLPLPFEEENLRNEQAQTLMNNTKARSFMTRMTLLEKSMASRDPSNDSSYSEFSISGTIEDQSLIGIESGTNCGSLYFLYAVDLATLQREAISLIHAPGVAHKAWSDVEASVSAIKEKTQRWLQSLPTRLQFDNQDEPKQLHCQSISLGLQFYSSQIMICQPCLRQVSERSGKVGPVGQGVRSTAAECIDAAGKLLQLLPGAPDVVWLYDVCPWWCVVHYIMQAVTVAFTGLHVLSKLSSQTSCSLSSIRKALHWLKRLSAHDPSARQALHVCSDIISSHGSTLGLHPSTAS